VAFFTTLQNFAWAKKSSCRHVQHNPVGAIGSFRPNLSRRHGAPGLGWLRATAQLSSKRNLRSTTHLSAASVHQTRKQCLPSLPPRTPTTRRSSGRRTSRSICSRAHGSRRTASRLRTPARSKRPTGSSRPARHVRRPWVASHSRPCRRLQMNGEDLRETAHKPTQLRRACRQTGSLRADQSPPFITDRTTTSQGTRTPHYLFK
jgi:hypothetical protein